MSKDNRQKIELLNKALKFFPENTLFYYKRAVHKMEERLFEEAIKDFDTVILHNDKYWMEEAFYKRGASKYILGDTASAFIDRQKAIGFGSGQKREYADYCRLFK